MTGDVIEQPTAAITNLPTSVWRDFSDTLSRMIDGMDAEQESGRYAILMVAYCCLQELQLATPTPGRLFAAAHHEALQPFWNEGATYWFSGIERHPMPQGVDAYCRREQRVLQSMPEFVDELARHFFRLTPALTSLADWPVRRPANHNWTELRARLQLFAFANRQVFTRVLPCSGEHLCDTLNYLKTLRLSLRHEGINEPEDWLNFGQDIINCAVMALRMIPAGG